MSLTNRLTTALTGRYRLERELGAGGLAAEHSPTAFVLAPALAMPARSGQE